MIGIKNNWPHVGFHRDRLGSKAGNPREVALMRQWWLVNNGDGFHLRTPLLSHLIGEKFSDRDAQVAATVIQWLGTNVGMSFIEDVVMACPEFKPVVERWGQVAR